MTAREDQEERRQCCFQQCFRLGRRHHWGWGFTFCEEHMGRLEKLVRNRPMTNPTSRKEASPWK